MPNTTNTSGVASVSDSTNNTLGVISLQSTVDTATLIEFPLQKGYSVLEITPADLGDTTYVADSAKITSVDTSNTVPTVESSVKSVDTVVTPVQETVDSVPSKTSFTEFDEKVFRINYVKLGEIDNGWMFWALLFSFITYSITRIIFPNRTASLFKNVFNYNFAQKEFHKSGEHTQLVTFISQCLFSFVAGMFVFFALKHNFDWQLNDIQELTRVGMLSIVILVLYFLKKMLYLLVADIFARREYASECIFNVYLINRALGICLFPIVVALAFVKPTVISTETLLVIGYLVIGFFYVYRIFREFQVSVKNHVSLIYIFLYFCTLEILPIMVLVKIIVSLVFVEFRIV